MTVMARFTGLRLGTGDGAGPATAPPRTEARRARMTSPVVLAAVVGWGLWSWRSELTGVPYLDDSSVHEQMVRFALRRLQGWHLPLTSWFPYLGLGSPQFLHYQSLPAMLTGALGLATGGDAAFRISLYLLLSLWPLSVYWSARLFDLDRGVSLLAAAAAPLLMSAVGVGYEAKAYVWIGYGVWAQLWASWMLPLAWAFTWRAMSSRRAVLPAAVFVALTTAMHFETGYLALIPIVIFPFLTPSALHVRLRRAAGVALGALGLSAWVTVPVLVNGRWAATNEILAHTPLVNGYGARQVMTWLVGGQLFDAHRAPVITLLAGAGLVVCVRRRRTQSSARALVALLTMSLLLSFGRTTFGSLTVLLPGSTDIFMRRFMMGAQLAGLYLAGMGGVALARAAWHAGARAWPRVSTWAAAPSRKVVLVALPCAVGVAVLAPAWSQMGSFASFNARAVSAQRAADGTQGAEVNRLVAYVDAHGGGRVYAGMPSNWGSTFRVGAVPVFKYLESLDVDEVGYTLRTASLMTDPEYFFDEDVPGDFALFAVHYMVLPAGFPPPVPAHLVMVAGPYRLWVLPARGYLRVVDTIGVLSADRTDVGVMSVPYLRSDLPGQGHYLAVAYGTGAPAPLSSRAVSTLSGPPGTVRGERDDLPDGVVTATITAHRPAVIALSASFDPGWTVRVDGRQETTQILAPALVGVAVGPGVHKIVFSYTGFSYYPELLAVLVLTLAALLWASVARPPGRPRRDPDSAPATPFRGSSAS